MRTMLISLILFCSLTQFAIAEDGPPAPVKRVHESLKGCGTTYSCVVPERCTNNQVAIAGTQVSKITKETTPIFDDCPAIVRFHVYDWTRAYVSIESLATEILAIDLFHKRSTATAANYAEFSCRKVPGPSTGTFIMNGGYKGLTKELKFRLTELEKDGHAPTSNKMKCSFEIKLRDKRQESIFDLDHYYAKTMQFQIDNVKTDAVEFPTIAMNCNPPNMNSIEKSRPNKKYIKAKQSAGKYTCEYMKDDVKYLTLFKMEYRLSSSDPFKPIDGLTCNGREFYRHSDKIVMGDYDVLDITCAADAHFFCGDVKTRRNLTPDQMKPTFEKADWKTTPPKASKLKCPGTHPHLIIVKKEHETPYTNVTFQCENYGGESTWRVVNAAKKEILTEAGPEVYCTNKLKCDLFHTISENSVHDGEVDKITFLPQCFTTGTLYVKKEGKENQKVADKKCDFESGNFKYMVGNEWFVIGKETKFVCTYPPINNQEKIAGQTKKLLAGGGIGIGVTAAIAVVLLAAFAYLGYRRDKKEKERRRKAQLDNKVAWQKYCLDEAEEKAYNKANPKANPDDQPNSTSARGEPWNWNPMLMSFQYNALSRTMVDGENGLQYTCIIRQKDKIDFAPTEENAAKCAAIYTVMFAGSDVGKPTPERAYLDTYDKCMGDYWEEDFEDNPRGRLFKNVIEM